MSIKYSAERSVQIIIYLLKEHGIKRIIASPGATNVTFVASVQNDSYFEVYSCIDERSAAYMACGMASQTGEPVVLSCTGATSSRNYLPGLTEAFYSNLPILAVTSMMNPNVVGNLVPQSTDRSNPPRDTIKRSYHLPLVTNSDEEWEVTNKVNEALLELRRNGGGPVHLRLTTAFVKDYSVADIAPVRVIRRYYNDDVLPEIRGSVAIFVGAHSLWNTNLTNMIEQFCEKYGTVVFCDKTSNYYGKHRVDYSLVAAQKYGVPNLTPDILIHLGGMSGDYYTCNKLKPREVWRIDLDGEIKDRFKKITAVFEMSEMLFFEYYLQICINGKTDILTQYKIIYNDLCNRLPKLPFSNIWMASILHDKLPANSILYMSILNSLRAWNFFEIPGNVPCYSNVGGFGIDGMNSTILGAALVKPEKIVIGISGDLGFFYDLNALGYRSFPSNIRILLVNNGRGQEFKNYGHVGDFLGDMTDDYIAAAHHNGDMSPVLVKHFAEDLGFEYISASNKEEFNEQIATFVDSSNRDKPLIFEVFTDTSDETNALEAMCNINNGTIKDHIKTGILKARNIIFNK